MGVYISVVKPIEFLGKEYSDELVDELEKNGKYWCMVASENFEPIQHLTQFERGLYSIEFTNSDEWLCMSYSTYNDFRNAIYELLERKETYYEFISGNLDIDTPFIELLWFTDCDGVFDYKIAQELYEDFVKYLPKAEKTLNEDYLYSYKKYIDILKKCIDNQAVVLYH